MIKTLVFSLLFSFSVFAIEPLKIIDVHTHANFTGELEETSKIPVTEEEFKKELKEANVVAAISHTTRKGSQKFKDLKRLNVFQCFGVTEKIDLKSLETGLKKKDYQCIKIYLGYVHRYAYDKAHTPVYKLAQKYDVPVVFHTGDTYSAEALLKYSDPLTIDEVAVKNPKVNFVIAHLGNPWVQSAAEVTYKNPNVFVEASALLIGDLKKVKPESLDEYAVKQIRWAFGYIENPAKFMFGTDWPLVRISDYVELYKKAIPKEHWQAVFHDNAARVFKIKEQVLVTARKD